jgi:peptide/nickel transport system substrate-binding protein
MQGYWDKVLDRRIGRRRAIAVTGATAASAAFLAACGGSDDDGGGSGDGGDSSGLLQKQTNETSKAKHGGLYVSAQTNGLVSHDPHANGAHTQVVQRTYSQLFRIKYGELKNTSGEFAGDLAQSWELSPDQLTLTVKLDPGAGFAPLPPVNGRPVDAEDVVFSWERVAKQATLRGDLANSVNPSAPITSVTATDKSTVVIKLNEPNSTLYTLLGLAGLGTFWIIPKEAADEARLNVKTQPLGSGPYYLTESNEVNIRFKKNPNFKRASLKNNEPYIEEIYTPVIVDPATLSSQFRAGAVYHTTIPALEVVDAKKSLPKLLMYPTDPITNERVYFGHNPDSPFIDDRMRRAFYRVMDRDAYVRAAYNADRYEADGLEVPQFWEGSFGRTSWEGWLLDPKSKSDYGDVQSNFVFDLAEAKKLVEAAGHKTPFQYDQVRSAAGPTSFARPIYDRMQIIEGMIDGSGVFKANFRDLEWATEWNPQIRQSKGKFSGTSWGPDTSSFDPAFAAFFLYHPQGGYFEGGDSTLEQMTLAIRREFDVEKRKGLLRDLQKYDAKMMFNQKIGVAGGFGLTWPIVRNAGVFRGGTNWLDILQGSELNAWIDETQAPKGNA